MRRDGKSELSKVETILKTAISENMTLALFEFEAIDNNTKNKIIKNVTAEYKNAL